MAQHRTAFTLGQSTPYTEVRFGLKSISQTLQTHLTLKTPNTDLTLSRSLNEQGIRFTRSAKSPRNPTLVVIDTVHGLILQIARQ